MGSTTIVTAASLVRMAERGSAIIRTVEGVAASLFRVAIGASATFGRCLP